MSKDEVRIVGHGQREHCNRKHRLLAVPSMEEYWKGEEKERFDKIGLFGYGTSDNQWAWTIDLLSPFSK